MQKIAVFKVYFLRIRDVLDTHAYKKTGGIQVMTSSHSVSERKKWELLKDDTDKSLGGVCVFVHLHAVTEEAHDDLSVSGQAGRCGLCGCSSSPECS